MKTIRLDAADAGRARPAALGDMIEVALDETPTSGYRWEVETLNPGVLSASGDAFDPSTSGRMGGGGVHVFRFEVVGAGSSPVRLILRRPWDQGSVADAFEATIEATVETDD
jgi:inhibitor of cysteine peptidase